MEDIFALEGDMLQSQGQDVDMLQSEGQIDAAAEGDMVQSQGQYDVDMLQSEGQIDAAAEGDMLESQGQYDIDMLQSEGQIDAAAEGDMLQSQGKIDAAIEGDMLQSQGQIDAAVEGDMLQSQGQIDEGDMLQSQGQIDATQEEEEQAPPNSYIDFFAREVNMVPNVADQSDIFARENQLNDVPDHVVDYPVQLSDIPFIDFFPLENQLNNVPDHVVDQPVENDQMNYVTDFVVVQPAEQLSFLYYDFFNSDNQQFYDYYALENHRLSAAAYGVEQSVQDMDYYAPEDQLLAAANVGEQAVLDIDQSILDINYYALDNQLSAIVHHVVGIIFRDIDYMVTENELIVVANAAAPPFPGMDNINMEYQRSIEPGVNILLMGENGEVLNAGHSDPDAITEFEPFPDVDPPFNEHPASRSVVRNLASVTFTQERVERDSKACAVCQDEFKVGEMAKKLPCSHYYHDDCILPWLDRQNTCPVCRYKLPVDNNSDDEGEENASLS